MTKENISLEPRAAKLTKSGRVNTPKGRLAFVTLAEPKTKKDAKPGAKPKYSVAILIPKGADLSALKKLRDDKAKEKWGDKIPPKMRNPIKKAIECVDKDGNPYTGFDDPRFEYCIWPTAVNKPGVVNGAGVAVTDSAEMYSGRWGLLNVHAFTYDTDGNRGVSFGLDNVQLLDHDESLGGRAKASDEFEAVAGVDSGGGDSDSVFDE